MPWKEKSPTPDQIKRRLAYLIACRCRQIGQGKIADAIGVDRDTLRRYADPDYAQKGGPKDFEIILKIFKATGDDFAQVMYAAQNSTDAQSFWAMLHCVLVAQQNLHIRATNEERLGGNPVYQPVPIPRTRSTDPRLSLEPIYEDDHLTRRRAS